MQPARAKLFFLLLWLCVILGGLYLYFVQPTLLSDLLGGAHGVSVWVAYAIFLFIGALRGFTLIPSTYLIVLGVIFFPPIPLFILILSGIIISSLSIYYFSEFLHFDAYFEKNHAA